MFVDVEARERSWIEIYKLCIGFITPRPIALVSTISASGILNLAPFSFYTMVSGNPPVVLFCPTQRRNRQPKDTLRNILETREFVIATVSAALGDKMAACAAELPFERSEFEYSGLTPTPAAKVRPPLVKESPANIECRLRQIVTTGDDVGGGNVVFGDILAIHVDPTILDAGGLVDPHKLSTVGRLGGSWYSDVAQPYERQIPKV